MEEMDWAVALTELEGIGPVLIRNLLDHFGSAAAVFDADRGELTMVEGMGNHKAAAILEFRKSFSKKEKIKKMVAGYLEKDVDIVCWAMSTYPQRLKHCFDAPAVLYVRGHPCLNLSKSIAVVGTRRPDEFGRSTTKSFIEFLPTENCSVISGLAYGIDAVAHQTSLSHQVKTIAVLASGVDVIYPPSHQKLAQQIVEAGGNLVSEWPPGTPPEKHHFPNRNRIIAGLSDAVVVVQTGIKGGSMITAEQAFSYNREVFACPGRANDLFHAGCNQLIKDFKAHILLEHKDLFAEMDWDLPMHSKKEKQPIALHGDLSEKEILTFLQQKSPEKVHLNELLAENKWPAGLLAEKLLSLHWQNLIKVIPGKWYQLVE